MLESLVSDRTTPKGKKSLRTHLSDAHIAEIEEFHAKSFYWSYLLNLSGILALFFYSLFNFYISLQKKILYKNVVICRRCGIENSF